jgi:hypothetical protein
MNCVNQMAIMGSPTLLKFLNPEYINTIILLKLFLTYCPPPLLLYIYQPSHLLPALREHIFFFKYNALLKMLDVKNVQILILVRKIYFT